MKIITRPLSSKFVLALKKGGGESKALIDSLGSTSSSSAVQKVFDSEG